MKNDKISIVLAKWFSQQSSLTKEVLGNSVSRTLQNTNKH